MKKVSVDRPGLDIRFKIILFVLFTAAVMRAESPSVLIILSLLLWLYMRFEKVPFETVIKGVRGFTYFILLTFIFAVFFTPGNIIFSTPWFKITFEGLEKGLLLTFRLALLVGGGMALAFNLPAHSFIRAFTSLLSPFKRLGLPVGETAFVFGMSLKFLPGLYSAAERIKANQLLRGADYLNGNIFRRARALVSLLLPLIVVTIKNSEETALALESRYFDPARLPDYDQDPVRPGQSLVFILCAAVLTGCLLFGKAG